MMNVNALPNLPNLPFMQEHDVSALAALCRMEDARKGRDSGRAARSRVAARAIRAQVVIDRRKDPQRRASRVVVRRLTPEEITRLGL